MIDLGNELKIYLGREPDPNDVIELHGKTLTVERAMLILKVARSRHIFTILEKKAVIKKPKVKK